MHGTHSPLPRLSATLLALVLVSFALLGAAPVGATPSGIGQVTPAGSAQNACYHELESAYSEAHGGNTPQSVSDRCNTLVQSLPSSLPAGFDAGNWADCVHSSLGGIDNALGATAQQLQPAYQRCAAALAAAPPATALPTDTNTSDYVACAVGTLGEIGGPADVSSQYQAAFQKCASGAEKSALAACAAKVAKYLSADSDFPASTLCNGVFQ
jgi:hypothetical protein